MGTDLRARANSAFVAVSAYTRPRKSKPKIYVYVEDDIDKAFWRVHFSEFSNDYRFVIEVFKVSGNEIRGKDAMLKAAFERRLNLGSNILICVDADYDLLIDNYHYYSDFLRKSPYIITTKWYSIENLKCHPSKTEMFFDKMTLRDEISINFDDSLKMVSKLFSELFLILLVSLESKDHYYEICSFGSDLKALRFNDDGTIESSAITTVNSIKKVHTAYRKGHATLINNMRHKLSVAGYNDGSYWKIMRGHDVAEIIVQRLILTTAAPIIDARLQTIGKMSVSRKTKQDLCCQYQNQIGITKLDKSERIMQLINDCTDLSDLSVSNDIRQQLSLAIKSGKIAEVLSGLMHVRSIK